MADLNLDATKEFVRDTLIDIGDADRCVSMSITPATGTLHRRLHRTIGVMNALIAEVERLRTSSDSGAS